MAVTALIFIIKVIEASNKTSSLKEWEASDLANHRQAVDHRSSLQTPPQASGLGSGGGASPLHAPSLSLKSAALGRQRLVSAQQSVIELTTTSAPFSDEDESETYTEALRRPSVPVNQQQLQPRGGLLSLASPRRLSTRLTNTATPVALQAEVEAQNARLAAPRPSSQLSMAHVYADNSDLVPDSQQRQSVEFMRAYRQAGEAQKSAPSL